MADDKDIAEGQSPEEEERGPIAGERLAEARRELQIPVIEIAKELHLDEYKVRALENNEFEVIGAPVFAKGHLRKYAQLVKVAEADVMADYYQLNRSVTAPPVVVSRAKPRRVVSPGPWVAAIIVVALAATAYWWFAVREVTTERPATGTIAPLPQESDNLVEDETVTAEVVDLPAAVEAEAEVVQTEPESEPVAEPATDVLPATIDPLEMRLSVSYSGDCWTEITDSSGGRLFFDLGKAGRTVNLSGQAPFNVLFGNAENVSIEVNGTPYAISAADRRGRTARLTIAGS